MRHLGQHMTTCAVLDYRHDIVCPPRACRGITALSLCLPAMHARVRSPVLVVLVFEVLY